MVRHITQRELRNNSGDIMRALDRGEVFVVTRNGTPVGVLQPMDRRRFVSAVAVVELFADAAPIDAEEFRRDVDRFVSHDVTPRA